VVEEYVYRNASRFGRVVRDGRLAGPDCAAVRAFQRWAMIPQVTGSATPITAAVATRLSAARPAACRATGRAVTLCVDLSSQTMWAVRAGRLVLGPTVARTGRRGEATPTGWYRITQRKRYTVSSEYGTPLWFWQRFYRDFGFHAAVTPMYAAVGGSHGCVNLLPRDAAAFWLARRGSRVHVFGRKPGT
jgi:lipoprotein-anchoring transpeptidase ErfK/SrfK